MSLFGESTGVIEEIHLPDVSNVDKREMLNWERELIGLYVSAHPLTPYQQTFTQIVSYFSGQLPEAQHEEKVRVAGLITAVRPYTTKTNKPMGFVARRYPGQHRACAFPEDLAEDARTTQGRPDHYRRRQSGYRQHAAQNFSG
jgi:DNA polymerase-3 subunit alpha